MASIGASDNLQVPPRSETELDKLLITKAKLEAVLTAAREQLQRLRREGYRGNVKPLENQANRLTKELRKVLNFILKLELKIAKIKHQNEMRIIDCNELLYEIEKRRLEEKDLRGALQKLWEDKILGYEAPFSVLEVGGRRNDQMVY